jgi:hypothetical protein
MYVLDFQSRIAQEKMRILKNNYSAASIGVFFIDAIGNTLNGPYQQDQLTTMPILEGKIRIKNQGDKVLFMYLVTDLAVDHELVVRSTTFDCRKTRGYCCGWHTISLTYYTGLTKAV